LARKTDIRLRRSATAGNAPSTSDLNLGELALNTYDGAIFLKTHDGSSDAIAVAADARTLSIDYTNQRVGIGDTSPDNKLHINSGADNINTKFESTDTEVRLLLKDSTGTAYIAARNDIRFGNDTTTERMRITSAGKVGIGTITPSHELAIRKDQDSNTELSIVNLNSGDSASALLRFRNHTSASETGNGAYIQLNKFNAFKIWNQFGNPIVFGTNNAEKMRLDTNGNLGIGTTNPTEPLSIHASDPKIKLQDTDGTSQVGTIFQAGAMLGIQSRDNTSHGSIKFQGHNGTTGLEYARFISSGNFGIGTGAPGGGKLVVQTVSGEYGLRLQDNSSHYFRVAHGGNTEIAGDLTLSAGALTIAGNATFNGSLEINHNPLILDTNPGATYGVSEALRIDDSAGTNDRALQIYELLHSGGRHHRLTFNTQITTDGSSAYTYTQGNYGGSSQIQFGNNGEIVFYTNPQDTGGSATAITPLERFRVNSDGDIRFEGGNLFYDASANALNFIDNVYAQFGSSNDLQIFHDGSNSIIKEAGTGNLRLQTGNSIQFRNGSGADLYFNAALAGATTLYHNKVAKLATSASGVEITGNITNTSGDLTLDVAGDIYLDAGGDDIYLSQGGTHFGELKRNSSNLEIHSLISNGDIVFKGSDDGSTITALTLDMSEAGRANFNNDIGLNDGRALRLGSNDDGAIYNDGSNTYIKNSTNNHDIIFQGNDDGSAITALTIDMSNAGKATFNADVIVGGNLTVNGTTTTINTATLDVEDLNITVAKGVTTSAGADGAGLTIEGPTSNASLIWDHGNQYLEFNKDVFTSGSFIIGTTSTNVGRMYNSSGVMALEAYTARQISFGNATNGEHVRIDADGNVGIGTTAPRHKLSVNGTLGSSTFSGFGLGVVGGIATAESGTPNAAIGMQAANATSSKIFAYDYAGSAGIPISIQPDNANVFICAGGGNVGIGTTSPSKLLHIKSADPVIRLEDSSPSAYAEIDGAGGDLIISCDAGDNDADSVIQFKVDNSEKMRLNSSGNFGIGTTSPSSLLHLNATSYPKITLTDTTGVARSFSIGTDNETFTVRNETASSNPITISNANVVTFNGAYSFPTADGSSGQVLKTDGSGNLSFQNDSGGGGSSNSITDADNDTKIQVEEGTDDDTIRFDTAGTERALFNANGLDIKNSGGLRISGTEVISSARNLTNIGTISLGDGHLIGDDASDNLVINSSSGESILVGSNQHIFFNTGATSLTSQGTTRMFINSSGNVGIGNSSPSQKLHVTGNIYAASGFVNSSGYQLNGTYIVDSSRNLVNIGTLTTASTIKVDPASGDAIVQMEGAGGAQILRIDQNSIRTTTSSDLSIFTSGNTRQIFLDQSAANIGFNMGSDTPHAGTAVHIKGHDTTPDFTATAIDDCTLVLSNSDDDYGTIFGQLGTGTGVIQARRLASAVYYNLALNPHGGKVGINQVAPLRTLEVGGAGATMRVGPDYYTLNGSTDRDYVEIQAHGTDSKIVSPNERFHIENTSGDIVLTASGNTGIGTTAPQSKLETNLHSGADSSLMNANSVNDVHLIRAGFGQNAASTTNAGAKWGLRFVGRNDSNYDNQKSGAIFAVSEDSLGYNRKVGLAFHTSSHDASHAERMRIDADGKVGIGTTSPDTSLDVTAAGVQGLIINQDTSNAAVSARMFFKDNVRTNGFVNVNGVLEARTGMAIGSTSGTKIVGIGPTQVHITTPVLIEEYQIDTVTTTTSATSQAVISQSGSTVFRSCRYTVQITNSTDSTYHTTELLLVHDGTTANITEFGTIFTGAAIEATFDADISSGNIRLLATPASTDTMVFKVVRHSITV